jgi:hypothetical protein
VGGEYLEVNASRLLVGLGTRCLHLRKSPYLKKRKALARRQNLLLRLLVVGDNAGRKAT